MAAKKKKQSYSQKWVNTVKRHNRAADLGQSRKRKTQNSTTARKKKK